MKRVSWVLLSMTVMLFVWDSAAAEIRIGGGLGLALSNDNAKSGIGFEGKLAAPVANLIALEAGIFYYSSETEVDYLSEGDYSLFALSGSVLIESRSSSARPFAGIGIAYFKPEHSLSDNVERILLANGIRAEEKLESKVGAVLRGGVNITISPKTIGQFSLSYYVFEPDAEVTVTNLETFETVTVSDSVTLSTFVLAFTLFFNAN